MLLVYDKNENPVDIPKGVKMSKDGDLTVTLFINTKEKNRDELMNETTRIKGEMEKERKALEQQIRELSYNENLSEEEKASEFSRLSSLLIHFKKEIDKCKETLENPEFIYQRGQSVKTYKLQLGVKTQVDMLPGYFFILVTDTIKVDPGESIKSPLDYKLVNGKQVRHSMKVEEKKVSYISHEDFRDPPKYRNADSVFAVYDNNGIYPGIVLSSEYISDSYLYVVKFYDGDIGVNIKESQIRLLSDRKFELDQDVEAYYQNQKKKTYRGTIKGYHCHKIDGTDDIGEFFYKIKFNDGDVDDHVPEENIFLDILPELEDD
jgi:hypothetical protein